MKMSNKSIRYMVLAANHFKVILALCAASGIGFCCIILSAEDSITIITSVPI